MDTTEALKQLNKHWFDSLTDKDRLMSLKNKHIELLDDINGTGNKNTLRRRLIKINRLVRRKKPTRRRVLTKVNAPTKRTFRRKKTDREIRSINILSDELERLINRTIYHCERLRSGYVKMMMKHKPEWIVTLTFEDPLTKEVNAIQKLEKLLKMVDKAYYGKGAKNKKNRLMAFPFLEKQGTNLGVHFHLLIKVKVLPKKYRGDLKQIFKAKWQKIYGHGFATLNNDKWFEKINTLRGSAIYVTKQTRKDNNPLVVDCLNY
jgi:hypothetical protein